MPPARIIHLMIRLRAVLLRRYHTTWAQYLERFLQQRLSTWFDATQLHVVRVDPAITHPNVQQQLMRSDAVHPMHHMAEFTARLGQGRDMFMLLHPNLPCMPLIFVQIAYTQGMAGSIGHIIGTDAVKLDVARADTAMFYSISNVMPGLAGIKFGHFLLMQVIEELQQHQPHIDQFATLSPIPGFSGWLSKALSNHQVTLRTDEQMLIAEHSHAEDHHAALALLLETSWHADGALRAALKPMLMRLCAEYLLHQRHPYKPSEPYDPVARFHLFNGACLKNIHWMADSSPKTMAQSYGMMVNYHYNLSNIAQNHADYKATGKVVASDAIEQYTIDV